MLWTGSQGTIWGGPEKVFTQGAALLTPHPALTSNPVKGTKAPTDLEVGYRKLPRLFSPVPMDVWLRRVAPPVRREVDGSVGALDQDVVGGWEAAE